MSEDLTSILDDSSSGDARAADALLEKLYSELHALAEAKIGLEAPGVTLQPTALVHEAYLRLVDQSRVEWQGQTHFKAVAATAMKRALVDYARKRKRAKRGGNWRRVTLDDAYSLSREPNLDMEALHTALEAMRELDERQARVMELRVFGGLTGEETARVLDVSTRTVDRDWKMGQAWMRLELERMAAESE